MNNGKICVSVCAKTADELIEQIKRAEELADVIEIRFDCLDESEFDLALQKVDELNCSKPFLATFRPKSKDAEIVFGLRAYLSDEEKQRIAKAIKYRFVGWEKISSLENVEFFDFETDIQIDSSFTDLAISWNDSDAYLFSPQTDINIKSKKIIFSEHFFENTPTNLDEIFEGMKSEESEYFQSDIIKIAVQTKDITDSIPIWQLIKKAKSENKEIIPIAMGESGKWTRILGMAHGAFMTYASLDSDKETAPGQVTAKDLIEVYRAKELDETTDVYGILGNNVGISLSPYMHNTAFKFHKLNSVFVPLQVHDLDEFIKRMVKPETREVELNFKGFSVTIPHKQSIIKHLDYIDETARKIGAVNTVKIVDGKLHGFNTDAKGFIEPLKQVYGDLSGVKVAILGAGGASKACQYALEKERAVVTGFDGNQVRSSEFRFQSFSEFDVIVNSTPLGMKGKFEGETPLQSEQMKGVKLVYDLVYIPFQTQFMTEADQVDVPKIAGIAMLIAQALEQQKIWTGLDAPMKEISAEVLRQL